MKVRKLLALPFQLLAALFAIPAFLFELIGSIIAGEKFLQDEFVDSIKVTQKANIIRNSPGLEIK
jgi:hypothetical protein